MAVLIVSKKEKRLYIPLIEQYAHEYLRARKIKFDDYFLAKDFCRTYGLSYENFFKYVQKARDIHGVLCGDGTFLLHPDGIIKKFKNWSKKMLKSKKQTFTYPITEKEIESFLECLDQKNNLLLH